MKTLLTVVVMAFLVVVGMEVIVGFGTRSSEFAAMLSAKFQHSYPSKGE